MILSFVMSCDEFLDTSKVWSIKEKIDTFNFINIENVCSAKGTVKRRNKTSHKEGENIYKHIFVKGLMSKIHKGHFKLSNNKTLKPIQKWAKDLNRHLSEDNTQVVNTQLKTLSPSFVIKEVQWDTTTYLLEWLKLKNTWQC